MKILLMALIAVHFTLNAGKCFSKPVVPAPQPLPTAVRAPREVADPKVMMAAEESTATALDSRGLPIEDAGVSRKGDSVCAKCYTSDGRLHILNQENGRSTLMSVRKHALIRTTDDPKVLSYLQARLELE